MLVRKSRQMSREAGVDHRAQGRDWAVWGEGDALAWSEGRVGSLGWLWVWTGS